MKSMTDFIMEQETVKVVEEEFDEAKLVSEYMAVCAAAANVACVCEYASIASFCEANGIEKPAIIQEGATLDAIFGAIGGFFKKIADWFLGLVKGITKAAGKAKITELIAKLKALDNPDQLVPNTKEYASVCFMGNMTRVILKVLETFADRFADTANSYFSDTKYDKDQKQLRDKKFNGWTALKDDLDVIATTTKWKSTEGDKAQNYDSLFKTGIIRNMTQVDPEHWLALEGTPVTINSAPVASATFTKLIAALETVLKLDIPNTGDKIIKEFKIATDKMKEYKDDGNGNITKTTSEDKEMTKLIQDCANNIAKAYDGVATGFVSASIIATKDISLDLSNKDTKEKYNEELENAEKDKHRTRAKDLSSELSK